MIKSEKDLEEAYKRLDEIDAVLKLEYDEYGETVYASQLELDYESIENEICDYEEDHGLSLSKVI